MVFDRTNILQKIDIDKKNQEEGIVLSPRYDANGLVTAVVTDFHSGDVLMVAHMNEQALQLSIETGIAHYWSRSRKSLWKKGESSGNRQLIKEMRVDCDQDAVWLKVEVEGHGATCHTGRIGCFYRRVINENGHFALVLDRAEPLFDPNEVY